MTNLVADAIFNEFSRLGVSTNQDLYSGLMCDSTNLLAEGRPSVTVVKIYDDHSDGLYDGDCVLGRLQNCKNASLDPNSEINAWELIAEFEL